MSMAFRERLGIEHPVLLAPMVVVSCGRLAAAVSQAGGLGLLRGCYGDGEWLEPEWTVVATPGLVAATQLIQVKAFYQKPTRSSSDNQSLSRAMNSRACMAKVLNRRLSQRRSTEPRLKRSSLGWGLNSVQVWRSLVSLQRAQIGV
jgi:NAD(P)H-dependent flavin oxidoreductase YrpB (nitropropane dioxygenase family)